MELFDFMCISTLARNSQIEKTNTELIQRGPDMKWIEIISLRCAANIDTPFVSELLKGISESDSATDTPEKLVEIRVYYHSIVETDLSIHIYWESEAASLDKSPLGLRFASALKPLGLLNHSVWVEIAARTFAADTSRPVNPRTINRGISI
jgi:hypothetical protein